MERRNYTSNDISVNRRISGQLRIHPGPQRRHSVGRSGTARTGSAQARRQQARIRERGQSGGEASVAADTRLDVPVSAGGQRENAIVPEHVELRLVDGRRATHNEPVGPA